MASEALIVDAVRSPIGRRNGSLAGTRGDELAGQVLNGLVARHDLDPAEVEDVQMGCVTQIGEQGWPNPKQGAGFGLLVQRKCRVK